MKTAIIVHGRPEKEEYLDPTQPKPTEAHWLPWLKAELEKKEFVVHIPEMPVPYHPIYEDWKKVFEQYALDEETVLIGHSRGGSFLLRWLSEHIVKVHQLVLVAPSIMPNPAIETGFSGYTIDPKLYEKVKLITLFYSSDDEPAILQSAAKIREVLPGIDTQQFTDKGHFTSGDGVTAFPELLSEIDTN